MTPGFFTDKDGTPSSGRVFLTVFFVNLLLIMNFKVFGNDFSTEIATFLTWGYGIIFGGGALKTGAEAINRNK